MKPLHIVIAGNIGAGKTSLTNLLAQEFDYKPYFESVDDNPYLADLYSNAELWSFHTQVYFLTTRFRAHKLIQRLVRDEMKTCIQDRSIYEDRHIFARMHNESGLLKYREFSSYIALYEQMTEFLTPPDLLIYLQKSSEVLLDNIKRRNRTYEAGIDPNYIVSLNSYYDDWVDSYSLGEKVIISSDTLDFVNRKDDAAYVLDRVHSAARQF
jgi:deoxyadenosine/deoxycytidine kinase